MLTYESLITDDILIFLCFLSIVTIIIESDLETSFLIVLSSPSKAILIMLLSWAAALLLIFKALFVLGISAFLTLLTVENIYTPMKAIKHNNIINKMSKTLFTIFSPLIYIFYSSQISIVSLYSFLC